MFVMREVLCCKPGKVGDPSIAEPTAWGEAFLDLARNDRARHDPTGRLAAQSRPRLDNGLSNVRVDYGRRTVDTWVNRSRACETCASWVVALR